jgi:hypothetical protein
MEEIKMEKTNERKTITRKQKIIANIVFSGINLGLLGILSYMLFSLNAKLVIGPAGIMSVILGLWIIAFGIILSRRKKARK